MADSKISNLTSASTLTGTEEVPIVQGSVTVKATTQDIADLAGGGSLATEDQEIDSTGERKIILGGTSSTDTLTIYDQSELEKFLEVRGDGNKILNYGTLEVRNDSGAVNGVMRVYSSGANTAIYNVYNTSGQSIMEVRETGAAGGSLTYYKNGAGAIGLTLSGQNSGAIIVGAGKNVQLGTGGDLFWISPPSTEVANTVSVHNGYLVHGTDNEAASRSGTTANRPTTGLFTGRMYFDTDLGTSGKPIWYDGANWVDATGTTV